MDVEAKEGSVHTKEVNSHAHDEKQSLVKRTDLSSLTDNTSHQNSCEGNESQKSGSEESENIPADCDLSYTEASCGITEDKRENIKPNHGQSKLLECEERKKCQTVVEIQFSHGQLNATKGQVHEKPLIICSDQSTQMLAGTVECKDDEKRVLDEKHIEGTAIQNSTPPKSSVQAGVHNEEISQQEQCIISERDEESSSKDKLGGTGMDWDSNNLKESRTSRKEEEQNHHENTNAIGIQNEKHNQEEPSSIGIQSEDNNEDEPSIIGIQAEQNNQDESSAIGIQSEDNNEDEPSIIGIQAEQNNQDESSAIGIQRDHNKEKSNAIRIETEHNNQKEPSAKIPGTNDICTTNSISESINTDLSDCMPVILNVRGNANDLELDVTEEFDESITAGNSTNTGTAEKDKTVLTPLSYGAIDLLKEVKKVYMKSSAPSQVDSINATPTYAPISTFSTCPISKTISLSTSVNLTAITESLNNRTTNTTGISSSSSSTVEEAQSSKGSELSSECLQNQSSFITGSKSTYVESVSDSQISDSHLKSSLIACQQPPSMKEIAGKEPVVQPRYMISLLNPSQSPVISDKVTVTTAAINSLSVSGSLSGNMNHIFQSTHETPTILVNSQRPRVIITQEVRNGPQPKLPTSLLMSSESHVCPGSTNQAQISCISALDSSPSTGMNRDEILQSGLLKISKKPRKDMFKEYVCNVCGEEFYNEEFLNFHIERNVFVLKYFCSECFNTLIFNNKCAFWQHILKEVSNREERLETERTFIRLDPFLPKNTDQPSVSSKCTSPATKECPYCFRIFSSASSLRCHFEEISKSLTPKCNICGMILFNRCSMAAHKRIHAMALIQTSAHCPECGFALPYSQDLNGVFEHLDNCYHFNVSPTIICKCGAEKKSVNEMKEHVLKQHLNLSFRRQSSGTLLKYLSNRSSHSKDICIASPLITCSLCDKVFHNPATLQKHVETKVASLLDHAKHKRYKCTLCSLVFPSAGELGEHTENAHTHKPKRCTMCFGLFKSRQNLVSHLVSKSCTKKFPKCLHMCLDSSSENEVQFDNSQYSRIFQVRTINDSPTAAQTHKKPNNFSVSTNRLITNPIRLLTTITSASNELTQTTQSLSQQNRPIIQLNPSLSQASQFMSRFKQSVHPQKEPSQSCHPQKRPASQTSQPVMTQRQSNVSQAGSQQNQLVRVAFDNRPTSVRKRVIDGRKYQCHSCKICLIGSKNFEKHMSHHGSIDLITGRTHCVVCKKMVIDSSIHSHLEEHQNQGVIVCTLCHQRNFSSVGQARDHSRNWCYYQEVSGWGEAHFRDKQIHSLSSKAGTSGLDQVGQEKNKSSTDDKGNESPPEPNLHENEPILFPCLMCGLAFTTKQAKDDHVSRVHDGTKTLFFCSLCKKRGTRKSFSRKHKASLHISRKHRIINPTAISKLIIEEERNMTSGQVVLFDISAQERSDASPPKRLRLEAEGTFLCGKCGFSDGQRDSFEQHIKSHNPKNEPQCPECGLCFTVYAALKKHIFAVHKIKGVDEYLNERGIKEIVEEIESDDELMDSSSSTEVEIEVIQDCDRRPPKSLRGNSGRNSDSPWECTVCYKKYSCEAVLKSHMRNHGMAFIRSKRHIHKSQASPVTLSQYKL